MKKTLLIAFAIFNFTVMHPASASDHTLQSGSAEASREAGRTFVALIYGSNPIFIEVSQPTIDNEWATLQTKSDGKICNLTLQRNASANKYGWVVSTHSCH